MGVTKRKIYYYLCIHKIVSLLIVLQLLFLNEPGRAQLSRRAEITKLVDSVKTVYQDRSIEKIYLQLNKPEFNSADTIWFKAYLFNAILLKYSQKSGLIYVEIATADSNRVINRSMLPIINGLSWGSIALNKKDFPEGSYTLRAYTSWMRNFAVEHQFLQRFNISSPEQQSWLLKSNTSLSKLNGKDRVNLAMQFHDLQGFPMGLRKMQINLTDGKRRLLKEEKESSMYGELELDFELPQNSSPNNLRLLVEHQRKGEPMHKLNIPLTINRPENTDLQFMPEGGHLVAGHLSNIAFKAIAEDGKGSEVSGVIMNQNQEELCSFKSSHLGMGRFSLTPQDGDTYVARVLLPDGNTKDYSLPPTKNSGTTLKILNKRESDSLEVQILSSRDVQNDENQYFLIGQTNGMPYYGASILLKQGITRIRIDKNLFPSGVCQISLLNNQHNPLNERLVYIDHKDHLKIQLNTHKPHYKLRDSISLAIFVQDQHRRPVQGSFSISVSDDSRVKRDSLKESNILSSLLLDSDLKGNIESPGYYFLSEQKDKAWVDLDNLLLSQGWAGFSWPEILNKPKPLLFEAENELKISGRVSNIFNKPVENSEVLLLSKKPFLIMDTLTNEKGRFTFRDLPLTDTAVYMIQSRNKRGKSFNVGIEVDEFIPPIFPVSMVSDSPWFINSDTLLLKGTRNMLKNQALWDAPAGSNMLEEVVVSAKKIIKNSKNKNGSGNADYVLDEEDMLKAKKKTLYELLEERYPGFRKGKGMSVKDFSSTDTMRYVLMNSYVNLVIDGVNIKAIGSYEENYMDYLTAEDITGIEILKTPQYAWAYDPAIMKKMIGCRECPPPPLFLEVTTRSGNGAFLKKTPGVYLYKPLPISFPTEFYRPKYLVNKVEGLADLRSTIHWEPNIITDAEGKANISFYSADLPAQYSIIMEGTDMNGGIGFFRKTIQIKE